MEAAPAPIGVAAASPTPPPQWSAESRWIEPPNDLSVRLPSKPVEVWSRPVQGTAVVFLLPALVLLSWHAWSLQRWGCRPATLETNAFHSSQFDLNLIDQAQLLQLPGVGPELAQRIEVYRAEHHGFRSVEELRHVPGVGPKLLDKLRPYLYLEVPTRDGEDATAEEAVPLPTPKVEKEQKSAVGREKESPTERMDINHASATELRRLPGIGPTLSQRILETRTKQPFQSVDDLRRVRGIGPKTLERIRPYIVVER